MRLTRGKHLLRVALCAALVLGSAGAAAAATPAEAVTTTATAPEKPPAEAGNKDKLLLPAVPVVAYSRETSFLFGVMVVRALRWKDASPDVRPNTIAFSGFYSLENQ